MVSGWINSYARVTTRPLLPWNGLNLPGLVWQILFYGSVGSLRSNETFGLRFDDVEVLHPIDGASAELPPGCGAVTLTLLPETKGNRTACGDVVMAYHTAGGFSVGRWFPRLRRALDITHGSGSGHVKLFTSPTGRPWTSRYFRHTYLYPSLLAQRAADDPHLSQFDGSPGKSLTEQF